MLERFKVPEKDRIYVPVDRIGKVTEQIFMHVGVDEEGAKASTAVAETITLALNGNIIVS